jgi:hypothetical protein
VKVVLITPKLFSIAAALFCFDIAGDPHILRVLALAPFGYAAYHMPELNLVSQSPNRT